MKDLEDAIRLLREIREIQDQHFGGWHCHCCCECDETTIKKIDEFFQ